MTPDLHQLDALRCQMEIRLRETVGDKALPFFINAATRSLIHGKLVIIRKHPELPIWDFEVRSAN